MSKSLKQQLVELGFGSPIPRSNYAPQRGDSIFGKLYCDCCSSPTRELILQPDYAPFAWICIDCTWSNDEPGITTIYQAKEQRR